MQDWFLRYELKTVPDVAEVASVGGMVRAHNAASEVFFDYGTDGVTFPSGR